MAGERRGPDDPEEWLSRARSNLVQAEGIRPGVYLEDLCFQAQQAAEEAFKALLLARGIRFPYIHDLAELVNLLERGGVRVPAGVREAARLTPYAVDARYPGTGEPVLPEEHAEAARLARAVVRWVEARLAGEG